MPSRRFGYFSNLLARLLDIVLANVSRARCQGRTHGVWPFCLGRTDKGDLFRPTTAAPRNFSDVRVYARVIGGDVNHGVTALLAGPTPHRGGLPTLRRPGVLPHWCMSLLPYRPVPPRCLERRTPRLYRMAHRWRGSREFGSPRAT